MEVLSTSSEIASNVGINEKKCRELLSSGVIPCITTGTSKKRRYYTTDKLLDFTYNRISSFYNREYESRRDAFLEKDLSRNIHFPVRKGRKAEIITVANLKGGVGKTTDTINLAVLLSKLGQRVLIVDMDAQAQSSRYFKKVSYSGKSILSLFEIYNEVGNVTKEQVHNVIVNFDDLGDEDYSIDILPSEIRLTKKLEITRMTLRPERILSEILSPIVEDYDFIFCDTPPYPGLSLELSFFASSKVILSTEAEEFSIEGMESTIEELNSINQFTEKTILVDSIFVNNFNTKLKYQGEALELIKNIFQEKIGISSEESDIYTVRRSSGIIGQSQVYQLPIISWRPRPREVLSTIEPFFDYVTKLIKTNTLEKGVTHD